MKKDTKLNKKNQIIFILTALLTIILIGFFSPIKQSENYHLFAEQRHELGIPHIGDVISNLAFILVGIILLYKEKKWNKEELYVGQSFLFKMLAWTSIGLGLGSGYYHWNPTNSTLAWDRATMVLGFAVIFYDSLIRYKIACSGNIKMRLFIISSLFLATVYFWTSVGRLEPYVFVQFFTMFSLIILVIVNKKEIASKHLMLMFVWYLIAKICETYDKQIFNLTYEVISGHTLKHVAYAIALYEFGKHMLIDKNLNKLIFTIKK